MIFKIENGGIVLHPNVLLIKSLRDLLYFNSESYDDDSLGFRLLKYIYLTVDRNSPYILYGKELRERRALSEVNLDVDDVCFKDPIFINALSFYKDSLLSSEDRFLTTYMDKLEDIRITVEGMEVNGNNLKQLTDSLTHLEKIMKAGEKLKANVSLNKSNIIDKLHGGGDLSVLESGHNDGTIKSDKGKVMVFNGE